MFDYLIWLLSIIDFLFEILWDKCNANWCECFPQHITLKFWNTMFFFKTRIPIDREGSQDSNIGSGIENVLANSPETFAFFIENTAFGWNGNFVYETKIQAFGWIEFPFHLNNWVLFEFENPGIKILTLEFCWHSLLFENPQNSFSFFFNHSFNPTGRKIQTLLLVEIFF